MEPFFPFLVVLLVGVVDTGGADLNVCKSGQVVTSSGVPYNGGALKTECLWDKLQLENGEAPPPPPANK